MKKRIAIAISLLILFTTISFQQKINVSQFNIKIINIENNLLIKEKDVKKLIIPFYNQNLIFLKNKEIKKALMQNSFIESFNIKKKYPDTLIIEIFEKKPIAILLFKKEKFYLSEKIDLIKFKTLPIKKDLPYVIGNKDEFKIFHASLKKIDFPLEKIKKYTLYENNRWDLETNNNKLIKLPTKEHEKSLLNYLDLIKKDNFKKYRVFDYRINNQLILK